LVFIEVTLLKDLMGRSCSGRYSNKADQESINRIVKAVRSFLMSLVHRSSPRMNVAIQQRFRSKMLDIAFTCVALCVSELFMTFAVPITAVLTSPDFATELLLLFSLGLYSCNFLKTLLKLPRPEKKDSELDIIGNDRGYGFPSSHTLTAISVPCFLLETIPSLSTGWHRAAVLGWGASIIFSRLYLGVHSIPDVLGGAALGLWAFRIYMWLRKLLPAVHALWCMPALLWPVGIFLVWVHPGCHPSDDDESLEVAPPFRPPELPTLLPLPMCVMQESTIAVGVSIGALLSGWHRARTPALFASAAAATAFPPAAAVAGRVMVALGTIVLSKLAGKPLSRLVLRVVLCFIPFDRIGRDGRLRRIRRRSSDTGSDADDAHAVGARDLAAGPVTRPAEAKWFDNCARMISYPLLAVMVFSAAPWACKGLGI
jgi:membrane-associated phospholipid phosphatase